MTHLRRFLVLDGAALLVLVLPFLAEAVTGRTLPDPARGALWSALVGYSLLLAFPFVDPFRTTQWDAKPLPQLRLALVVVLVGFALLEARALFGGSSEEARQWTLLSSIAVLAVIGNAFPALPRNLFIGVRVPWTLRDAGVWTRTHRMAGRWMVASAVVLALLYPVLPPSAMTSAVVIGALAPLFAAAAYSWHLSRTL